MRKILFLTACFFLFFGVALNPTGGYAQVDILEVLQGGKKTETSPTDPQETFQKKLDDTKKEISDIQESLNQSEPGTPQYNVLTDQRELLEELQLYYQQILEAIQAGKQYQNDTERLKKELELWSQEVPPEEFRPTFSELDRLEGQLQLENSKIETSENTLETLKTSYIKEKDQQDSLDKERRRAKEELETNKDPSLKSDLQKTYDNLRLESLIAQAKANLVQMDFKNENLLKTQSVIERDTLKKKIQWLKTNVQFTEEDLQKEIEQLGQEKQQYSETLKKVRKEYQAFESELGANREKLNKEELKIARLRRQGFQNRINVLAQRYQRLDEIEETWRRRFLAYNGQVSKSRLEEWSDQTELSLEEVRRQESVFTLRLAELRKDQAKVHDQLKSLDPTQKKLSGQLETQVSQIQDQISLYQDFLSGLYREQQLYKTFLSELEPKVSRLSITDQGQKAWSHVMKVWNFELTSIDDRPITVKKLVFVLILLLLGYKISRRLSRWLGQQVLPRFGLEKGVAAGLQTLTFYLLVTLVTLIVLYTVNVPLTLFTVLGGAIAIGVGFGSQNIVRNFISSLILLMEQPIKIGDMVEVDGTYGTIERIGARSTRIRRFNNVHVIVPNSDLLEKNVINWTLSDDSVRVMVAVGVAYGSPTRDVAKLIRKAVDEHGRVSTTPEPIVIFKDFGDNALIFEVHFWIKMRTLMDRERIQSDIRFRIDSLFREAGITIAFPQRDVHLDSLSPLEVKLLPKESEISLPGDSEDLKAKLKEKHGDKLKSDTKEG